jgi:Ca-activated chloride channel family protein
MKKNVVPLLLLACWALFLIVPAIAPPLQAGAAALPDEESEEKIDDWCELPPFAETESAKLSAGFQGVNRIKSLIMPPAPMAVSPDSGVRSPGRQFLDIGAAAPCSVADKSIGFAVGGAKDSQNFKENIKNGYVPPFASITPEGVFYEHYFETGDTKPCKDLFCPSYAKAISRDLYSGQEEYYLTVGLNSGLTEKSFARKKLNLVVVLDISGSMGSSFDRYHYDKSGKKASENPQAKMQIANESIVAMMKHLGADDRLGIALFDDQGYKAKPLRLVGRTNMEAISKHVLEIKVQGGTNWQAGYTKGLSLFDSLEAGMQDPEQFENRIVFITDAMPNRGELSEEGLFGMVRVASQKNIFTSFVGVGVDFNNELVESVTKTRGANYFSVHNADEFRKRMDQEFDFMVTPLVFDLQLLVKSEDFEIETVYGSPEADMATGSVMKVNTLFPSPTEEAQVKGGVVLIKLRKKGKGGQALKLTASYEDRSGKKFQVSDEARFDDGKEVFFDNSGIRKAVLLAKYVTLMQNWIFDSRKGCQDKVSEIIPTRLQKEGLHAPQLLPEFDRLPTWERSSCALNVSDGYKKLLTLFQRHFIEEKSVLADDSLNLENDILMQLIGKGDDGGRTDDWKVKK